MAASPSFFDTEFGKTARVLLFGGVATAILAASTYVAGVLTDPKFVFNANEFFPALGAVVLNAVLVYAKNKFVD